MATSPRAGQTPDPSAARAAAAASAHVKAARGDAASAHATRHAHAGSPGHAARRTKRLAPSQGPRGGVMPQAGAPAWRGERPRSRHRGSASSGASSGAASSASGPSRAGSATTNGSTASRTRATAFRVSRPKTASPPKPPDASTPTPARGKGPGNSLLRTIAQNTGLPPYTGCRVCTTPIATTTGAAPPYSAATYAGRSPRRGDDVTGAGTASDARGDDAGDGGGSYTDPFLARIDAATGAGGGGGRGHGGGGGPRRTRPSSPSSAASSGGTSAMERSRARRAMGASGTGGRRRGSGIVASRVSPARAKAEADALVHSLQVAAAEALAAKDYAAVVSSGVECIRYVLRKCGPHDPRVLYPMLLIARAQRAQGRTLVALEYLTSANLFVHDHSACWESAGFAAHSIAVFEDLGYLYMKERDYRRARDLLARVCSERLVYGGDVGTAWLNLGRAEQFLENTVEAGEAFERALTWRTECLGPMHPLTAAAETHVGNLLLQRGKPEQALPYFGRAYAVVSGATGPSGEAADADGAVAPAMQLATADVCLKMSTCLRALGRNNEAEIATERALRLRELALGPEHVDTCEALLVLGRTQQCQGRLEEALAIYRRALLLLCAASDTLADVMLAEDARYEAEAASASRGDAIGDDDDESAADALVVAGGAVDASGRPSAVAGAGRDPNDDRIEKLGLVKAEALAAIADVFVLRNDLPRALEAYQSAEAEAAECAGAAHARTASYGARVADVLFQQGRVDAATSKYGAILTACGIGVPVEAAEAVAAADSQAALAPDPFTAEEQRVALPVTSFLEDDFDPRATRRAIRDDPGAATHAGVGAGGGGGSFDDSTFAESFQLSRTLSAALAATDRALQRDDSGAASLPHAVGSDAPVVGSGGAAASAHAGAGLGGSRHAHVPDVLPGGADADLAASPHFSPHHRNKDAPRSILKAREAAAAAAAVSGEDGDRSGISFHGDDGDGADQGVGAVAAVEAVDPEPEAVGAISPVPLADDPLAGDRGPAAGRELLLEDIDGFDNGVGSGGMVSVAGAGAGAAAGRDGGSDAAESHSTSTAVRAFTFTPLPARVDKARQFGLPEPADAAQAVNDAVLAASRARVHREHEAAEAKKDQAYLETGGLRVPERPPVVLPRSVPPTVTASAATQALLLNNLGNLLRDRVDRSGDGGAALACYDRSLALYQKVYGAEYLLVATVHNNIGHIFLRRGQLTEAFRAYTRALAIRKRNLGADHPDTGCCYRNLGTVHQRQGDRNGAMRMFRELIRIMSSAYGTTHAITREAMGCLASARRGGKVPVAAASTDDVARVYAATAAVAGGLTAARVKPRQTLIKHKAV